MTTTPVTRDVHDEALEEAAKAISEIQGGEPVTLQEAIGTVLALRHADSNIRAIQRNATNPLRDDGPCRRCGGVGCEACDARKLPTQNGADDGRGRISAYDHAGTPGKPTRTE